MKSNSWLDIDREGLRKLVAGRDPAFILYELLQNAWDEASTNVSVRIGSTNDGLVSVLVTDDSPCGFADLRHAYTVFAESTKVHSPERRGRFNLGEKLVLAVAREARVTSTTGTVLFSADGTRSTTDESRLAGSVFEAILDIDASAAETMIERAKMLLAPEGIATTVNGVLLTRPVPLATTTATLPTVIADDHGILRSTRRQTTIEAFIPLTDEAMLYELGIPVCEIALPWSLNIAQKVPLNSERDNVTPAYYRLICATALNAFAGYLDAETATQPWVGVALESPNADPQAVAAALDARYGEKRVVFDPSNLEANAQAINAGYAVVHGASFSRDAWRSIRASGTLPPAGAVFATKIEGPPGATQITDLTPGMRQVASFVSMLGRRLLGKAVGVEFWTTLGGVGQNTVRATYGHGRVRFAVQVLGKRFFEEWDTPRVLPDLVSLTLHEFAHDDAPHHLDERFFRAIQTFAGETTQLALDDPAFFTAAYHKGMLD